MPKKLQHPTLTNKLQGRLTGAAVSALLSRCPALHRLNCSTWALTREEAWQWADRLLKENIDCLLILPQCNILQ